MKISKLDMNNKAMLNGVDDIFFLTSAKKEFKSLDEKKAFKDKYLDYYAKNYNDYFFVATENNRVLGYICCCPDTVKDNYFHKVFTYYQATDLKLLGHFKAHLHINLIEQSRGKGLGTILIEHVCEKLKIDQVSGVHVFTTVDSQNVSFYKRNGFCGGLSARYDDKKLLFLGRKIFISNQ